jgi:hypothetical protein
MTVMALIALEVNAQDFVGSNVRLSKQIETGGEKNADEIGLIKLNNQNDEFSFDVALFPILSTPKDNDSIRDMNKKIFLKFTTHFHFTDLDFGANDGNEKHFTVPGEITLNNKTLPINLDVGIHGAMALTDENRGISTYPVLMSFIIDINPGDFGLDFETINFVRTISVEVRNGIINRSDMNTTTK